MRFNVVNLVLVCLVSGAVCACALSGAAGNDSGAASVSVNTPVTGNTVDTCVSTSCTTQARAAAASSAASKAKSAGGS